MRKDMTSEELRAWGYPELALYQEREETGRQDMPHEAPSGDTKAAAESAPPSAPLDGAGSEGPLSLEELKRLLGPLVSPLLRDTQGRLDISKLPAEDFEEFRKFLRDQVSVDGIAFNQRLLASYRQVLGKAEHEPLLRRLWAEGRGEKSEDPPQAALRRLTADLIAVSAERFVSSHLNDREGRRRLRGILGNSAQYSREIRADLSKAIASVGERQGIGGLYAHQSEKQISSWNYFNWGVSDAELREAGRLAEEILTVADEQESRILGAGTQYLDHPERVRALVSKERTIKPEEILGIARIEAAHREKADPLSQLRARLARFWLLAADSDNWRVDNAYSGHTNRLYLMSQTERLLLLTENVRDEAGLRWLNDRVQEFLAAPLPAKPGSDSGPLAEAWRWLEHKTVGRGLEELFEAVPEGHKSPYLQLKELSDTWKHSVSMGETLLPEVEIPLPLEGEAVQGDSVGLRRAVSHLSSELHKTKHQFWYQYKQHKALSRGASNVASWFGAGDIEDIREANRWIDDCLRRISQVGTREDLEKELQGLYRELKKNGKLFAAMQAAELEGTEQLIGLIQTVAEIAAISLLTQGMGTAGAIANAARAGRAMQTAAGARRIGQGAEALSWASKAEYGMKMGMAISATENAVAAGTGEVRQGSETLLAWGKDSLATGAAMSLFGPLAMGGGSAQVSRNLGKELFHRYAQQGAKGLGHLAKDTAAETGEELFDAQLRQGLDGRHGALGADQIREITLVSGLGGAQMGALNHGFRVLQAGTEWEPGKPMPGGLQERDTSDFPAKAGGASSPVSPTRWGNLLLAPLWLFLGAGGMGGAGVYRKTLYRDGREVDIHLEEAPSGEASERAARSMLDELLDLLYTGEESHRGFTGELAARLRKDPLFRRKLLEPGPRLRIRLNAETRELLSVELESLGSGEDAGGLASSAASSLATDPSDADFLDEIKKLVDDSLKVGPRREKIKAALLDFLNRDPEAARTYREIAEALRSDYSIDDLGDLSNVLGFLRRRARITIVGVRQEDWGRGRRYYSLYRLIPESEREDYLAGRKRVPGKQEFYPSYTRRPMSRAEREAAEAFADREEAWGMLIKQLPQGLDGISATRAVNQRLEILDIFQEAQAQSLEAKKKEGHRRVPVLSHEGWREKSEIEEPRPQLPLRVAPRGSRIPWYWEHRAFREWDFFLPRNLEGPVPKHRMRRPTSGLQKPSFAAHSLDKLVEIAAQGGRAAFRELHRRADRDPAAAQALREALRLYLSRGNIRRVPLHPTRNSE